MQVMGVHYFPHYSLGLGEERIEDAKENAVDACPNLLLVCAGVPLLEKWQNDIRRQSRQY